MPCGLQARIKVTIHTRGLELVGRAGLILCRVPTSQMQIMTHNAGKYARTQHMPVPRQFWPDVLAVSNHTEDDAVVLAVDCRPFHDPQRHTRGVVNHLGFHPAVLSQVSTHRMFAPIFDDALAENSRVAVNHAQSQAYRAGGDAPDRLNLHIVCFCKKRPAPICGRVPDVVSGAAFLHRLAVGREASQCERLGGWNLRQLL